MTCLQCGTEVPDGANGCPACGYGASVKLKLTGKAGELSTAVGLEFGKTLAAKVVGDEAKYMDDIQFILKLHDDKWLVKPYPRVKNTVFLNGAQLAAESELSDGDKLSLAGKAAFIDVNYI